MNGENRIRIANRRWSFRDRNIRSEKIRKIYVVDNQKRITIDWNIRSSLVVGFRVGVAELVVVHFVDIVMGFVEVVEIDVKVVVVRIIVDGIVLVSYLARYIEYQTRDIVSTRLNVEMNVLWDLKKMTTLGLEASEG
ncbi:hypothetical protein Tco_1483663 [Tanacetum coccineum]